MRNWLKNLTTLRFVVAVLMVSISGCQGGLTGIPSLSNLNNPTRVPPPSSGSFQIPPNYAAPAASGATNTRPTLGMLRSLETGKSVGDKVSSDGFVASDVTNGSFTSKPVVAQSVTTLASSANQFSRSVEAASAAFSDATGVVSSQVAELSSPRPDSITPGELNHGPAVIQAAATRELPDPRFSEASRASISSDDGIKWKSPQR